MLHFPTYYTQNTPTYTTGTDMTLLVHFSVCFAILLLSFSRNTYTLCTQVNTLRVTIICIGKNPFHRGNISRNDFEEEACRPEGSDSENLKGSYTLVYDK